MQAFLSFNLGSARSLQSCINLPRQVTRQMKTLDHFDLGLMVCTWQLEVLEQNNCRKQATLHMD